MTTTIPDPNEIAMALRLVARGIDGLARAFSGDSSLTRNDRAAAAMAEWGVRGLSRGQTSDLLKRHGLDPHTSGGWARGGWVETRDGERFLTQQSIEWLEGFATDDDAAGPFEH